MKLRNKIIGVIGTIILAGQCLSGSDWPQSFMQDGFEIKVHQPQVDSWDNYEKLYFKSAVEVLSPGSQEIYGAIYGNVETTVSRYNDMVALTNWTFEKCHFPNLPRNQAETTERVVRQAFNNSNPPSSIPLDKLAATVEKSNAGQATVAVELAPPKIFYSRRPAILVNFFGKPEFEQIENTRLLYAVNTNWDIIFDPQSGKYFLLNEDTWLRADNLDGEWMAARQLPSEMGSLPNTEEWADVRQQIPGKMPSTIPDVYISEEVAELIVTTGNPSFTPIPSTNLLYVNNSDADLFFDTSEGNFYFLTAGRWYRAKNLDGSWSSASTDLPRDFAQIPENSEKGYVLASVPGTPDAEAVALIASIPQKATVDRRETTFDVDYEGTPDFRIIKKSQGVYYATNTPYTVLRADGRYYACHNAVWFVSYSPLGPWSVAAYVAPAIYTIPAYHPAYRATYVRIYASTPDTVVVGYTSGYSGSFISSTGVLVFGLGFSLSFHHDSHYRPYYYHPHYRRHHYGFNWYSHGCRARWDYRHRGFYRNARYYGPRGGGRPRSRYNPRIGRYERERYTFNRRERQPDLPAYNPILGGRFHSDNDGDIYGAWGKPVVPKRNNWNKNKQHPEWKGTPRKDKITKHTKKDYSRKRGTTAIPIDDKPRKRGTTAIPIDDKPRKNDDLYVGKNGDIYRRGNHSWEKRDGKNWSPIEKKRDPVEDTPRKREKSKRGFTIQTPKTTPSRLPADYGRSKKLKGEAITIRQPETVSPRLPADYGRSKKTKGEAITIRQPETVSPRLPASYGRSKKSTSIITIQQLEQSRKARETGRIRSSSSQKTPLPSNSGSNKNFRILQPTNDRRTEGSSYRKRSSGSTVIVPSGTQNSSDSSKNRDRSSSKSKRR